MTITLFLNVTDTGEDKDYRTSQRALTLPALQVHSWRSVSRYFGSTSRPVEARTRPRCGVCVLAPSLLGYGRAA
jgi:hypothetical protein